MIGHTRVHAVQLLNAAARADMLGPAEHFVYVGMPGRAARAFGITDAIVGPFGKPWACLEDPRGWLIAYREYLYARIRDDADFALAVRDLHGKALICWCRAKGADTTCHADTLAAAAEWLFHGMEPGQSADGGCDNSRHSEHVACAGDPAP